MGIESVQKGTVPVDNTQAQPTKQEEAYSPPASEKTTEQQTQGETQGETQGTEQNTEQQAQDETQGAEQKTEQEELSPEERFARALEQRLAVNQQAQQNQAEGPEDVSFETQIEQQKEQIQTQTNEQLQQIAEQKAELQSKLEEGELDINKYMAEKDKLDTKYYEVQRSADRQTFSLESQLSQHQTQLQNQMQQARESYIADNPDFQQMYESGKIQEALSQPEVRNVFGDNPAAVHQYLKNRQTQQENEQLKQELAQLKEQQQNAVSQAASNPHSKVASQSGNNHPTNLQNQQAQQTGDPMVAALLAARQQA